MILHKGRRDYKPYLNYMYQLPIPRISDGSISAVSKPNFATKYSVSSIFEIYKIYTPSHRSNLKFCGFLIFFAKICKILHEILVVAARTIFVLAART